MIVGFRNKSAYGRWWEARTLWGAVVNNSRSWARQVLTCDAAVTRAVTDAELKEMQRRMVYLQIACVHALRQHLRGLEPLGGLGIGCWRSDDLNALQEREEHSSGDPAEDG